MPHLEEDMPTSLQDLDLSEPPSDEDAHVTVRSKEPNPLLCDRCQMWDDIWAFGGPESPLDGLRGAPAVSSVVSARCKEQLDSGIWTASELLVLNDDPFFLDRGYLWAKHLNRIYLTDPIETKIRLFMYLHIETRDPISNRRWTKHRLGRRPEDLLVITPQFCFCFATDNAGQLKRIEPWEIPLFDPGLIKKWILGCEKLHGRKCGNGRSHERNDLPIDFRVIDVRSMSIVKPPESPRFVVLSYMWPRDGINSYVQLTEDNLQQLETSGGLTNTNLPRIISDAIFLCRDLGETYLWVDSLSIVQDDDGAKHDRICAMDKIYRNETFCIIAALNDRKGYCGHCGLYITTGLIQAGLPMLVIDVKTIK